MEKIKLLKKTKVLLGVFVILIQLLISTVLPVVVNANILFPEEVTIEYDMNNLYTMTGKYKNGEAYSKKDAPLFAVFEGKREAVFCYEPKVMIPSAVTSGYKSNPLPDMVKNSPRAKYISVLWKYAGTDSDTQIVAQAMFWYEVVGLDITEIKRPNGTVVTNQKDIEAKINKIVNDYSKKPSFDGQKIKINLGEPVTLTDTNGSNLEKFARAISNTADIDWSISGNKLTITAKNTSKENGVLRLVKTTDLGTPVAYKKLGNQGVYAGAIDDPNGFQIPIEVNKTGEAKVTKLDKGTGKPVPGTEFAATYNGETQKLKTDADGVALFKDIPHDSLVDIEEIFVPAPYFKEKNNKKQVTVKAGHVTTVEFRNEVVTGKSTLSKIDSTTGTTTPLNENYPMTGAKFGWFKEDGTLVKEFTLADKFYATIDKQELAKYYWQETVSPVGYTLDPTKHEVELKYKDQDTPVVVKDAQSKEDVIRMNFDFQKLIQNETNEMFKNGVEFTATNQRTGEKTVVKTATVNGKKGYAKFSDMPLDDYLIEETKGVDKYDNIDPILIKHVYDSKTESFTFTVSDQKSGNELNEETMTQVELSKGENVDLGTYTLKDKAEKVTPPTPPTKDVTKEDNGESINEGDVALNSDFFYVLNSSVLQAKREDTTLWTIHDDYDENYDRYNGWFKVYATTDIATYKVGDELPNEWIKAEEKDGKVLFSAQQPLLDAANKQKDKETGYSIHASFYRYKAADKVLNTFVETVNDVKTDSNEVFTKTPKPEPHKFDLSKEKFDLTGDKLLDNDSEMKDRYEDSNKDPYNDKKDNNEKENINTDVVKAGDTLVYQLWLDTRPFDHTSKLTSLKMVDTYDKDSLTVDTSKVKVYNAKGEEVTKSFKVEDKDGVLTIAANEFKKAKNSKGEDVSIVDTEKIPYGAYYKIDAPMTVKKDVKAGIDIVNTADQQWQDSDGTDEHHITEKRVNKTPEPEKTPVEKVVETAKGVLPHTGDQPGMFALKVIGWLAVIGAIAAYVIRKRKAKEATDTNEF